MGAEAAIADVPTIEPGVYQHYKLGFYWVSGLVTIDEESGKYRVVYYSLTKRVWWAREYADFMYCGKIGEVWYERRRFERKGGRLYWYACVVVHTFERLADACRAFGRAWRDEQ